MTPEQIMIDLHSHTTESDGTLSPPELVQLARSVGVEVLAITDHDTFNGYDWAAEADHSGLELICGIELSTRFHGHSAHLLGYFLNGAPPEAFRNWIVSLQASRKLRNQELIARLQSMGINITMAEVQQHGKKLAGRPHFAQLLVKKNYATSIQNAFDEYLGESGACFVPRDEPAFEEAVERIVAAGGVPSLAHPARISRDYAVIEEYLREMAGMGLRAIEIYHSDHSPEDVLLYRTLADAFALATTGGSDFHGNNKPDIMLGTGRHGNIQIDISKLEQLRLLSQALSGTNHTMEVLSGSLTNSASALAKPEDAAVCTLSAAVASGKGIHAASPMPQVLSAALIATGSPLRLDHSYVFDWASGAVPGHIRSITRRLPVSFIDPGSKLWLNPRELASVEIEITTASLPQPVRGIHQFTVMEPGGKEAGRGVLIPARIPGNDYTSTEAAALPGLAVWLTGLSGAGKTTIAQRVLDHLHSQCCAIEMLDADVFRGHLCKDLDYSRQDREVNVRRLGFVADLLVQNGIVVLITAIAPYRAIRDEVRRTISRFIEVYVNAPLAVCEGRDVKGLYRRARAGEIRSFTGFDDPYEHPLAPEVECHTAVETIEMSADKVIAAIQEKLSSGS